MARDHTPPGTAPLPPEMEYAIARAARAKAIRWYALAAAAALLSGPLFLGGHLHGLIGGAILLLGIAAPLAAAGWFTERYASQDIGSGLLAIYTGRLETDYYSTGRVGRVWWLVLPKVKIPISSNLFGRLRLTTRGTVAYAPKSRILLRITEVGGGVLYQDPHVQEPGLSGQLVAGPSGPDPSEGPSRVIDGKPQGIAVLGEEVWVADMQHGHLLTLDRATGELIGDPIKVGNSPIGLAVAGGSVWAAVQGDGAVCRIDPASRAVVARVKVGPDPILLVPGPDDRLWVGNLEDPSLWWIGVLDNAAVQIAGSVELDPPGEEYRVAAGPGFVAISGDEGFVHFFEPTTFAHLGRVKAGETVSAVAFGGGAVWAAAGDDLVLVRIDPTTRTVSGTTAVPGGCDEIYVTGDSLWVASAGRKLVARIDLAGGALVETIALPIRPVFVAADENALWIAQTVPGRVLRVATRPASTRLKP